MVPKRPTTGFTVLFIACLAAPTYAQEVPGCRNAWNDLGARGAYLHAQTLIEADCPMMYREGWLIDYRARSSVTPSCKFSWNALAREGALPAVRFLVTHNCPVLERQGWRSSDAH
jgi:hypothetical protein